MLPQDWYYDPETPYTPPENSVTYRYGTWRWRFGAFSDRRGWPTSGCVWNERLVLFKGSAGHAGVVGDLNNFSLFNEQGEATDDMAFSFTLQDAGDIRGCIADDRLLILTATGMFALGPSNAAAGVGPGNYRADRQNNEGAMAGQVPVQLDGRFLYTGKARRSVIEASYDVARNRQGPIDLSRYSRHIGAKKFGGLVAQKDPNRLVWTHRDDGTLALAAYVPDEQVLGWATRPLAEGLEARSIAGITDPEGELTQVWAAVEAADGWHVCRMDQWRQEDDARDPAMLDLAALVYEGAASAGPFGPVPWLAGKTIQVQAVVGGEEASFDGVSVDGAGMFTIQEGSLATRVIAGLPYPCWLVTLPPDAGGDNGPAMGKMRRISRLVLNVLKARGLWVQVQTSEPMPIEQLQGDSTTDAGFAPDTGILIAEDSGSDDRFGQIRIERRLPHGATIRAIQPTVDVRPK